jgi:hypothetical protein
MMVHLCPAGSEGASYRYVHIKRGPAWIYSSLCNESNEQLLEPASGKLPKRYSMFTTVNNSAGTVSVAFSTMLLRIWNVSKEALESRDLQGLVNLTYLTTALQVSGVLFVFLLPEYKEDLERLKTARAGTSKIGGVIFLTITFSSIAYAISVGVMNIIAPGWMGES